MASNKFINNPDTITDEMLEGVAQVMEEFIDVKDHVVMRKGLLEDPNPTVTVMTLGGSGHEPSSLGFCGKGWEHLKVLGEVFAAPGPEVVLEGIRLADRGKGIFFYVGNHAGDIMSAKMAVKKAKREGIAVEMAVMYDDCSVFSREEKALRRNLCCAPTLGKLLGAAADAGYTTQEMKVLTEKYMDNVASLAAANRGATHPTTGLPISVIPEGSMVIGMGHHGEGAKDAIPMMTAADTVELMAGRIADDIGLRAGDEVLVTINGSGSTTYMELMILYKDTVNFLQNRGIQVHGKIVGEYITTQEQAGFILSMVRVDEEMKKLFDAPAALLSLPNFKEKGGVGMKNSAAFLESPGVIQIRPLPIPQVVPDSILIRTEYCGICGSDVGYFRNGRIGRREVAFPYILGHECAGEVVGMGESVRGFSVGDKVVLEPGLGCGQCKYCTSGRYNLCPDMRFMATPPYHGALQRYISYPARGCFKLPEKVSTLEGAMIEPLAVGLHAAKRGEVDNEKSVVITGAGCIGLMTLLACKARNARQIIISDVFQNRLDKALELGATDVINASSENVVQRVLELTGGEGGDVVFETAGRPETASQTVELLANGGIIVQVGTIATSVPYLLTELGKREGEIRSVFRYRNLFPAAIQLIERGVIDLKALAPSVFAFDEIAAAFDTAIHSGGHVVKCVLKF